MKYIISGIASDLINPGEYSTKLIISPGKPIVYQCSYSTSTDLLLSNGRKLKCFRPQSLNLTKSKWLFNESNGHDRIIFDPDMKMSHFYGLAERTPTTHQWYEPIDYEIMIELFNDFNESLQASYNDIA